MPVPRAAPTTENHARRGAARKRVVRIAAWLLVAATLGAPAGLAAGPEPGLQPRSQPVSALPLDSPAWNDACSQLPHRFIPHETARFVVLSDADPSWARRQGQCLERTHHQFMRFTRRMGIETMPLEAKLVCVLFDRREDYLAFAATHDDVRQPWIAGYYAPRFDRVVFYRGDDNPSVVEARGQLDEIRTEIAALGRREQAARRRGRPTQATALRERQLRYRDHLDAEDARVDDFARQINVSTTVHEAVHQLLFRTGVQSPRVQYPVWISEGLATTFETDDTRGAFGPDHEYAPRRETFTELRRAGRLFPLRELVVITDLSSRDDDVVHVAYHQSYALVTWMSRFRRAELPAYLELLREQRRARVEPDRQLALFERAFGEVETLERAWLRHERGADAVR